MDRFALWQRTLAPQADGLDEQREVLRQAFFGFRENVATLVGEIGALLPDLTVHDITHIDALWRLADEIAGPDYPLNPAEAFVLGGAFLLHDSAHVLAAYDGGLVAIKETTEWNDIVAQRFGELEPATGSDEERSALFQVLRRVHARQARKLASKSWRVDTAGAPLFLLDHTMLRNYYGDLIGRVAESHHWPSHRVAQTFDRLHVSAPAPLAPATWSVDVLKVAFLLRTSDAAHIDAQRAPWFLFALRKPEGISQLHWRFQTKLGQPARTTAGELRLASGSPFVASERQSWWLAYDTAVMIDGELRAARALMREAGRQPFAAGAVEHVNSPENFATNVRTFGWDPVNVGPKIGDVSKVISNLGGAALYGDRADVPLRELIQNAADAVRALRALGGLEATEGGISVELVRDGEATWLHVTDTGIGMSRHVLTDVLLDFGNSFWRSESILDEWPGLASRHFQPVGQFGIGFFSVFMIGTRVLVTTNRFRRNGNDNADQWTLEFDNGLNERPTLRTPRQTEVLARPGTRVSILLSDHSLSEMLEGTDLFLRQMFARHLTPDAIRSDLDRRIASGAFSDMIATLCPSLDIAVRVSVDANPPEVVIAPDDWIAMPPKRLLMRLDGQKRDRPRLIALREDSGRCVGRVGLGRSYGDRALMTHRGIRSGSVPGLIGVVLAQNNSDLARRNSRPLASREAWKRWATEWASTYATDANRLAEIHPLCPECDFPVFHLQDATLDAADLSEWIAEQSEIEVANGVPEWDPDFNDDVSRERFERGIALRPDVVFLPSPDGRLANALGFAKLDYAARLEAVLQAHWGGFYYAKDHAAWVANVDGVEILRPTTSYSRSRSSAR